MAATFETTRNAKVPIFPGLCLPPGRAGQRLAQPGAWAARIFAGLATRAPACKVLCGGVMNKAAFLFAVALVSLARSSAAQQCPPAKLAGVWRVAERSAGRRSSSVESPSAVTYRWGRWVRDSLGPCGTA
jgi:hypothetical protein